MDIDVDRLARRPDGPRLLIYLDQSTLSALATEEDHAELLQLLRNEVSAGRLICPTSPSHEDETARVHIRDPELWKKIDSLADELSLDISFRGEEEIEYAEVVWIFEWPTLDAGECAGRTEVTNTAELPAADCTAPAPQDLIEPAGGLLSQLDLDRLGLLAHEDEVGTMEPPWLRSAE